MGSCVDQIHAAVLVQVPWPHLEFEQFLPPEMAQRIDTDWPDTGWKWLMHSDSVLPNGTSRRRYQMVRDVFPDIAEELLSDGVRDAFRERLGVESDVFPQALLVEDAKGYKIRKHTDCAGKVITSQVYFADPGSLESQGVVMEPGRQIPYRLNSGYAFKVTKSSWHRVYASQYRRRSLQLIYYDTPKPKF